MLVTRGNDFIGAEKKYNPFAKDNFWIPHCTWGFKKKALEVLLGHEAEATSLWNYFFHLPSGPSVLLGPASMLNHGSSQMVNVRVSRNRTSTWLLANRNTEAGEELFTSYGSDDWFLDRWINYSQPAPGLQTRRSSFQDGRCMDALVAQSQGVAAGKALRTGEVVESPGFLLPRHLAAQNPQLMAHSAGDPSWDFVILPLAGTFFGPGQVNMEVSFQLTPEAAELPLHALVRLDRPVSVRLKALRPISPHEALVASTRSRSAEGNLARWQGVNLKQLQLSAAEAGDPFAQFAVAGQLRSGDALSWYLRAARQGHVESQFQAALLGSQSEKEQWYEKAAERGHLRAQLLLAEMYMASGPNASAAAYWARKALATAGARSRRVSAFADTFYALALAFQNPPEPQAFFWLQVAAEAGSVEAQYTLGAGLGDDPEARSWLQRAAAQGHSEAQLALEELEADLASDGFPGSLLDRARRAWRRVTKLRSFVR
ncbi:unnamed protein product [Effrenium voratum]|uniref:SET domain-containing protein n=1 Tax=Effrenium voratum TaxID=2562239 RepID=A0AA36MQ79_9DINO|nr:unnamed protein product [Effrenium voratum]